MAERRQEPASEAWEIFSSALKNHLDAPDTEEKAVSTATPEPIDTESAANTTATGDDDDDDEVKSKPSSQLDSPAPCPLRDRINSFRQRFTAIKDATLQCLERSFQSSIASIMFVIATIIGIKVLQSEVENAFEKYEKNIPKLFKFLDHYWNFYSYDILDKFIEKLAAKERLFEPVKKDMEAYKEDMGKFREETTIEQMLLEKELLAIEKTPPDAVEIFIEYDSIRTDSIKTLKDLREFRTAFSGFYMINECAILLKAIGPEFVVAWYIIRTDKKEDFSLEFGDSNIPKEALLFCASEIQQFVDFNVLRQQLQKHGIPESAVAMPATEEGSRPSFEDTCQMLQRVGGIEGGSGAIYHSLRETEGSVGDHKFIADKLEHRAQGMLHRVITLPEGCGPLNIFHLRMSDINEPRAGPTESESGGVFDSEPNAPSYILPQSTFLAMGEEMLAQSSKPQIPEPILKQRIFVISSLPSRPLSSDPEVKFVECSLYSEFSLAYTGIETEVCWEKAGIGLYLPKAELGREINFTVRVVSEDYVLPAEHKDMVLVSAMYDITASETLPEPVRVRMQHCTKVENENELQFMVAHGEPPFHFTPLSGGVFTPGKCYGEIELDKFSFLSVFSRRILGYSSSIDCAVHVGYRDDSSADFIVTKHISTHIEAVETKYKNAKLKPYDLTCSSSSTGISLTVPDTPTNGWTVEPEFEPAKIDMSKIVNYVPGRVIPHIKLNMMWSGHGRPKKEKINITVEGAEDLDLFKLKCEPQATYITPSQPQTTTPQSQLADTTYPSELELDTPTLPLLLRFPTKSGHFIDIIERIGEKGHCLCIILLNDNCGSLVKALEEKYGRDARRVAEAVMWLEKEPRTWVDLVKKLIKIPLGTLTNEIAENLVYVQDPTVAIDVFDKECGVNTGTRQPAPQPTPEKPTIPLLKRFPTQSGGIIPITERIGVKSHDLSIRLLNDDHGAITVSIEARHRPDQTEAVLQKWLKGTGRAPQSWATLVTVQREIGHKALEKEIEDTFNNYQAVTTEPKDTTYEPKDTTYESKDTTYEPKEDLAQEKPWQNPQTATSKYLFFLLALVVGVLAHTLAIILLSTYLSTPVIPTNSSNQDLLLSRKSKILSVEGDNRITVSGVSVLTILSFVYKGNKIDFVWEDAGISLLFPDTSYKGEIEISVAIFITSEELCYWPHGYWFMSPASATYDITTSAPLPAPVRVRIEHCGIGGKEDSLVFMIARGGPPFMFKPFNGGNFPFNESYGEIETTEFSKIEAHSTDIKVVIEIVYLSDNIVLIVVRMDTPSHGTAVREEYPRAIDFEKHIVMVPCTITKLTFSEVDQDAHKGWHIKLLTLPPEINMKIIREYQPGLAVPNLNMKLVWDGNGPPEKGYIQISAEGEEHVKTFALNCKPSGKPNNHSPQQQLPQPVQKLSGPQRNKIEQILQGVDWRVLANQLDLTDEVASIDGACQNLECKLREVVNRFINRQDLEPCHMTVEKIARALETLPKPLTKIPAELRNVCSPTE